MSINARLNRLEAKYLRSKGWYEGMRLMEEMTELIDKDGAITDQKKSDRLMEIFNIMLRNGESGRFR